jgi:hypothetical protein
MDGEKKAGRMMWHDLTVPNATELRDFYSAVVGWGSEGVDMGGYEDYNMVSLGSDEPAAGICFPKGVNKKVPPVWMVYITVDDLKASLNEVVARGGEILDDSRADGSKGMAVIKDPAGAICTLYSIQS